MPTDLVVTPIVAAALALALVALAIRTRSVLRHPAGAAVASGPLDAATFVRPYRMPLAVAAALTLIETMLALAWSLGITVELNF